MVSALKCSLARSGHHQLCLFGWVELGVEVEVNAKCKRSLKRPLERFIQYTKK
ncbi:GL20537 [Drosophila persimilis]|uniref:GL20537 n=1 Tax=Drosophila persimilis TaxID=7234 RepID=B4G721_DROPE|nr:GL20537 [Drosophila persimilis]